MHDAPYFSSEKLLWDQGLQFVAGADEVGRGALAGPVVAAAVVFDSSLAVGRSDRIIIRDSKKMTPRQREVSAVWIKQNALSFGIGEASVNEINTLGIVGATNRAYRRAIAKMGCKIDHLLVDAFFVPRVTGLPKNKQTPIIHGDSLVFSIAAASIIAKVYRDNLMKRLSGEFTEYLWHENKGYGTRAHQNALQKLGICKHHRRDFIKPFVSRD